jgi:hypothetical protein
MPHPDAQRVPPKVVDTQKQDLEKEQHVNRKAEAEKQQAERAERYKKAAERRTP